MTEEELKRLHKLCSNHKDAVEASQQCGCFYCLRTFAPSEITEWNGPDAFCPRCRIDSVLPDSPTPEILKEMQKRWFGRGLAPDAEGRFTVEVELSLPDFDAEAAEKSIDQMIVDAAKKNGSG